MSPEHNKGTTVEERRQTLLEAREEILMKYKTEKEKRLQWLVRFMDIEDELEELARLENRRTILGNLTSAGGGCQEVTDGEGRTLLLVPRGQQTPTGCKNLPVMYTQVKRVGRFKG